MTLPARAPQAGPPAPARVAVKVCGVTDPESALLSAELGASYLGLNFWPGSPRCLALPRAREIAAAVRAAAPGVALVGVFVNPTAAEVRAAADAAELDLLQFSGDETPGDVHPFAARAIKAVRGDAAADPATVAAFADCWGLLLDAPAAGAPAGASRYGGTGRTWDYATAAAVIAGGRHEEAEGAAPFPRGVGLGTAVAGTAVDHGDEPDTGPRPGAARVFLAGGISPRNVRRVVATLRPFAVDVCSGVESAPGRKDPRLLRQLFEEVRNGQAPVAP
jgi:phosphoribosylanthranilate isomerase